MAEKTPLELDLEHREKFITPGNVKALIGILAVCLIFVGGYALILKRQLSTAERETEAMKAGYAVERIELLRQIKQLRQKGAGLPFREDSVMTFRDQAFAQIFGQQ
ncbi:MAG: hypothetical protein JSU90_00655 [Nitrospiraceae bacterium]|nr:MAG: hypothetical protein JSU90_00655 [Nitrospiraceae bacterium]